jgi:hypothetical protein
VWAGAVAKYFLEATWPLQFAKTRSAAALSQEEKKALPGADVSRHT